MRELPFSSYKEVSQKASGRELILFGCGDIAGKTIRKLGAAVKAIVDNNPNSWDAEVFGLPVFRPESYLKAGPGKYFLVLCTTSFGEVSHQLSGLGFRPNVDFVVSPVLNDLRIIGEIESCQATLLFTSGAPPQESEEFGGGIYELRIDGGHSYRKVFSGNSHGIFPLDGNFIAVDDVRGLIELDKSYRVVRTGDLPKNSRGHGIAYSDKTGCLYVVSSFMDKVLVFDREFRPKGSFPISGKFEKEGEACHHCNDICVVGNSIYVSMFSRTGNWKRDIFDGAVVEMDLHTGEIIGTVIKDLWMPHNISFIEGSLVVLDSLRGELLRNNAKPVGRFPGFSRGLAYDGSYYYVGQSRNRNYSKFLGLSLNISIDASVIIFDEQTKVSRSIQLPGRVSEIHSIVLA